MRSATALACLEFRVATIRFLEANRAAEWIAKHWGFDLVDANCPIESALHKEFGLPTTKAEREALRTQAAAIETERTEQRRLQYEAEKAKLLVNKKSVEELQREQLEHTMEKEAIEYRVWKERLDAVFREDGGDDWPYSEWGDVLMSALPGCSEL